MSHKWLNWWLRCFHFKMETLHSVLAAIQKGDFLVSLDLQATYLHILIHQGHRHFLRFCYAGSHFKCFCRLSAAPRSPILSQHLGQGDHMSCSSRTFFLALCPDLWVASLPGGVSPGQIPMFIRGPRPKTTVLE